MMNDIAKILLAFNAVLLCFGRLGTWQRIWSAICQGMWEDDDRCPRCGHRRGA